MCVYWFIGKGFDEARHRFINFFVLLILYANNVQGVLRQSLFYQTIKFAFVLEFSIDSLKLSGVRRIRNGDWYFDSNSFGFSIFFCIQPLDHFPVIFVLQSQENSVIAHHIQQKECGKDDGKDVFQGIWSYGFTKL